MPSLIPLIVLLILCAIPGFDASVHAKTLYGVGLKIIDGDSFYLDQAGKKLEIRLYGIDCPEYSQPYSKKAKSFVRGKILHKKVKIIPYYKDSYGRLVAIVKYGEKTLNKSLLRAGFAWVHPGYCKKTICRSWKKEETKARKSRRGLWRDNNPISPWRWKRERMKGG